MDRREIDKCLTEMQTSGSEQAFEKLYIESRKGVFSFIYSFLKNYHDAEDIMQQTFINVRKSVDGYKPGTNGVAWLLEIAKNNCFNELKKRSKEVVFTDAGSEVDGVVTDTYDNSWFVLKAIDTYLDPIDRRIVLLHLVSDLKHREIAELTEIPLGTVLWRYSRAIKLLQSKLSEDIYEETDY